MAALSGSSLKDLTYNSSAASGLLDLKIICPIVKVHYCMSVHTMKTCCTRKHSQNVKRTRDVNRVLRCSDFIPGSFIFAPTVFTVNVVLSSQSVGNSQMLESFSSNCKDSFSLALCA